MNPPMSVPRVFFLVAVLTGWPLLPILLLAGLIDLSDRELLAWAAWNALVAGGVLRLVMSGRFDDTEGSSQ